MNARATAASAEPVALPPGHTALLLTAARCRDARRRLGWSAARLADAAGIAERTLTDFETGARQPRHATVMALLKVLRRLT